MLILNNNFYSSNISFKSARISDETRCLIFKRLSEGAGVSEIADELKIAKSTIKFQIKNSDFSGSLKTLRQEARYKRIIELLNQGNTLKSASELLGLSAATGRRILDAFSPKIDLIAARKDGIANQITKLINQGMTIEQIAGELKCSTFTVEDYIQKYDLRKLFKQQQRQKTADVVLEKLKNGEKIKNIAQQLAISPARVSRLIKEFDLFNRIV